MKSYCCWSASLGLLLACALPALGQEHDHAAPPSQHGAAAHPATAPTAGGLAVPSSMKVEHQHLHHQLAEAIASGGKTAEAAKAVEAALAPHFQEEEAYAMPPLGLLEGIARGQMPTDEQAAAAIAMTDKLRANYQKMLDEHQQVLTTLHHLAEAAKAEHKPRQVEFAESLTLHAQNEEQVLYPAALVLGNYLKIQRNAAPSGADATQTPHEH
jgi:hypothetical protein